MFGVIAALLCLVLVAGAAVQAGAEDMQPGDAGRALFHDGTGAMAVLAGGQVRVAAAQFPCAGCHGANGRGRREGGTDFPDIRWQVLSDGNRAGGAYSAETFRRAVSQGIGADGRTLGAAMPRFEASPETIESLRLYLARLDDIARRGITPDSLVLRLDGHGPAADAFAQALVQANLEGGVWGRRFVTVDTGPALVSADEISAALAPALRRALAARTVAEAARLDGPVRLDHASIDATMAAELENRGLHIDENAQTLVMFQDGTISLHHPDGVMRIGLMDGNAPAVFSAVMARQAVLGAIACGRGVTRACLDDWLANRDLSEEISVLLN